MTSQPGYQTITINILFNFSRSKGNQTIKFGQLIEHNKITIFLRTFYRKRVKDQFQTSFWFLEKLYMR